MSRQPPAFLFAEALGYALLLRHVGAQLPAAAAQFRVRRLSAVTTISRRATIPVVCGVGALLLLVGGYTCVILPWFVDYFDYYAGASKSFAFPASAWLFRHFHPAGVPIGLCILGCGVHLLRLPEALRISSIDRALACTDRPYFILAAVVGLQGIDHAWVPDDTRARWASALLELVRSNHGVISARASVTIRPWLGDGQIEEFIRSHPVPDDTASKNIISFALSRFGDLALPEFRARLRTCGVGFWRRRDFLRKFQEYHRKKQAGGAVFMTMPLLCCIPNYGSTES